MTGAITPAVNAEGKKVWILDISQLSDHPELLRRMAEDVRRNKPKQEQGAG